MVNWLLRLEDPRKVNSLKARRIMAGVAITFCVVMLIWFGGWAVWKQFKLWDTMTHVEYQNTLYVVMALAVVMGGGLTMRKSKTPLERPETQTKKVKVPAQNPVDLGPINKRLDELDEKVADLHVVLTFLKKGKEKDGEKS